MNERSSVISSILQNTAVANVTISVGLAGICLALLALTTPQAVSNSNPFQIHNFLEVLLPIIGVLLIFNAALTIDWVIDRFEAEDWKSILGEKYWEKNQGDFRKYDQIPARLKLFGGGYFLLCIGIAGLCFAILFQAYIKLKAISLVLSYIALSGSFWFNLYIIFQMMTYKTARFEYGLIALLLSVLCGVLFMLYP